MIKNAVAMNQKGSMDKGEKFKMALGMLAGIGADTAITLLLKKNIPMPTGGKRLLIKLGIFALALKVGEDIENYIYKVWDDTRDAFKDAKKDIQEEAKEEAETEAEAHGGE